MCVYICIHTYIHICLSIFLAVNFKTNFCSLLVIHNWILSLWGIKWQTVQETPHSLKVLCLVIWAFWHDAPMSVWPVMEFSRGETTTYERSLQCTRNLTRSLHNMFKVNRSAATGTICSEQVADPPPDHMIILRHLSSRPSFSCYLLVAVMLLVGGSATKQFCNPLNPTQQSCRTNSQKS